MIGVGTYWNYKNEAWDEEYMKLDDMTDEQLLEHIPQEPAAQGLFKAYRGTGKSKAYSFINVLLLTLGEPKDESIE